MQLEQAGGIAAPGGTASSAAPPAVAVGSVSPVQLGLGSFTGQLKRVDLLKPLSSWELGRLGEVCVQLETYAALVDSSFPGRTTFRKPVAKAMKKKKR